MMIIMMMIKRIACIICCVNLDFIDMQNNSNIFKGRHNNKKQILIIWTQRIHSKHCKYIVREYVQTSTSHN